MPCGYVAPLNELTLSKPASWSLPALAMLRDAMLAPPRPAALAVDQLQLGSAAQVRANERAAASALFCSSRRSAITCPRSTVNAAQPMKTPVENIRTTISATAPRSRDVLRAVTHRIA